MKIVVFTYILSHATKKEILLIIKIFYYKFKEVTLCGQIY